MHSFQFHIGDYLRDTSHLTTLEHGAYLRLLLRYYIDEKPIPDDRVARVAGVEYSVALPVLDEFFRRAGNGWRHSRADRVMAEYRAMCEKKREAGKLGGRPKNNHVVSREEPNGKLTRNQKPETTKEQELSASAKSADADGDVGAADFALVGVADGTKAERKRKPVPVAKIVDLYHRMLPSLPRCEVMTSAREGAIRQRWIQHLPNRETWENFFTYVGQSRFLMGLAPPREGAPPFRADLEWLTKAGNFAKIAEGRYHREQ